MHLLNRFIEIERHLENARFELTNSKNGAALVALIKAVEALNIELRNHEQARPEPSSIEISYAKGQPTI